MRQGDLAGDEVHASAARDRYGRRRFIRALRIGMENCVLDADEEMLVRIGEAEIDREFPRASLQPVEPYGERIQQLLRRERAKLARGALARLTRRRTRIAKLHRRSEIEGAPRTGLRLIAKLLQRIGLQMPRLGIGRVCKDEVVHEFCDPAIIALRESLATLCQQSLRTACEIDIAFCCLDRRMLVKIGGVDIKTADITLIDRLAIII